MKERLVEDWLTKVNERGFEIPFCQVLLSQGHRVLRVGHSPYEDGKDVLTESAAGDLHAYQLKDGDFSLSDFEKHHGQIVALVEAAPSHPNLIAVRRHKPFLVTTGSFSEPVKNRIKNLNSEWKRRRLPQLRIIEGRQLHADFMQLSEDFWPMEPPNVREFLSLYLAKGKSDLNAADLSNFLRSLLGSPALSNVKTSRKTAAANVFTSYVLREFYRNEDHWSICQAWIIAAAHIAWIAEKSSLPVPQWKSSFELALQAARDALGALAREGLKPDALAPHGFEMDDFTRARNTLMLGAISASCLVGEHAEDELARGDAIRLAQRLITGGRMWLWSEAAIPFFLATFWFCEKASPSRIEEAILFSLIDGITRRNNDKSQIHLADAYHSADDVLHGALEQIRRRQPRSRNHSNDSSSLESLISLAARRLLRRNLACRWHPISHTQLFEFRPAQPCDFLLWKCEEGEDRTRWFDIPQSWQSLRDSARTKEDHLLPRILVEQPDFALLFLLGYPHRLTPALVKYLDHAVSP